jgi:hypothetical protein
MLVGVLASTIVVAGQAPAPAKKDCVEGRAGKPTEPAGPPKKAECKSGTTGWSGALGGANIATEGGGTRDTKQTTSEAAKGLDPKSDGKKPPC